MTELLSLRETGPSDSTTAPDSQYPEIIAEIRHLQEGRTGWLSGIFVLLVSLALFTGARAAGGQPGTTLETLAVLVPVLLFHEAGHFAAMRVFGYRNLRMFFIPFFGAAVSGRHYNVDGWKKAVVSLMGPVPGIFAGGFLGLLGLALGSSFLVKLAFMAVVLNGFNLLPVLPLDGGWVVHELLFSRHFLLEGLSRILAVVALVGLALWAGDPILGLLALLMLISLPLSFRLARVTDELRREGLARTSPDDQTIPENTANAIIGKLGPPLSRTPVVNTRLAQQTLQVFETLNARPPGPLVSIALLLVQGASLVIALILVFVLVAGDRVQS